MIQLLIGLILAFFAWILIWSVLSLVKTSRLRAELDVLVGTVDQLRDELRRRRSDATAPPSAPAVPDLSPAPAPVAVPPTEPHAAAPPPLPVIAPRPLAPAEPAAPAPLAAAASGATGRPLTPPQWPSIAPPPAAPAAAPVINWEMFMGVKLFAWIGGLALFLGVAFFVKYSFENNLIPPAVRMALGYMVGAGLLAGGVILARRPYPVTAQTLCATGAVILYSVAFACRAIYHFAFFGALPTFLLMVLITATAFVVAVALEAQVVALLGMLGGFLTPVLLSTGVDNPLGLFGYIAVLDVGLLAVALRRRWHYLAALAALGTAAMQVGWVGTFFAAAKIHTALNVFLGFSVLFLLALLPARRTGRASRWLAGAAAGIAFVALGFAFYLLDFPAVTRQPWLLFTLVFGADLCLVALAVLDASLARLHLAAGTAAFLLLAAWTLDCAGNELLSAALGASFVFAILHTVFPFVLARLRPGATPAWWAHLFPPVALVLVLLAIARVPDVSFLVWPVVLAIDLVAIAVTVFTGAVLAVAATLILTLIVTGFWIVTAPLELAPEATMLLLTGGFGVLFFAAGVFALRRLGRVQPDGHLPSWLSEPADAELLPALSAVLPFLLLVLVVLRVPLAGPSRVFGLALLLVVLLLGLARMLGRGMMTAIAFGCVALLEYVWLERRWVPANAAVSLGWNLGFYALFVAVPFVFRRRFAGQLAPWIASALSAPAHFYLVDQAVERAWPNGYMGLIPALFAVPALASLVAALRLLPADAPRRLNILAWLGGVALLFITLIFPIQFERQWITISWALEGAALLWLFHRVPHPGLRLAGVGLLAVAFARLAFNPAVLSYHPRAATPIFNWYLYAYGLSTLALAAGAKLLAPPRDRVLGASAPAFLYTLAGVLAFLLLNLEIADYYQRPGEGLTFQFTGNFARDMSYTIAWALFAFGLLVLGIARRVRLTRHAAIGLLSVTLLKLFLHDLASLDQLYRIVAFLVVAIVAILASFLYQRFLSAEPKR